MAARRQEKLVGQMIAAARIGAAMSALGRSMTPSAIACTGTRSLVPRSATATASAADNNHVVANKTSRQRMPIKTKVGGDSASNSSVTAGQIECLAKVKASNPNASQ